MRSELVGKRGRARGKMLKIAARVPIGLEEQKKRNPVRLRLSAAVIEGASPAPHHESNRGVPRPLSKCRSF